MLHHIKIIDFQSLADQKKGEKVNKKIICVESSALQENCKIQIRISNEFFIPKLKFTESKSCIAGVAWYSRELLHRSQCNM